MLGSNQRSCTFSGNYLTMLHNMCFYRIKGRVADGGCWHLTASTSESSRIVNPTQTCNDFFQKYFDNLAISYQRESRHLLAGVFYQHLGTRTWVLIFFHYLHAQYLRTAVKIKLLFIYSYWFWIMAIMNEFGKYPDKVAVLSLNKHSEQNK